MVQQAMGSYMSLGGNEIVNAARLRGYVESGLKPSGFQIKCFGCDGLPELLCPESGPPPGGYMLPELPTLEDDPTGVHQAPWYDPAVPESKNFAGLLVTSVTVSSPYSREVTNNIGNGGTLGRLRLNPRTIVVHGFLIGKTCCATQYGLEWLTSALSGVGCGDGCAGTDLDYLACCPNPSGEDACITVVDPDTGRRVPYIRSGEDSEYQRGDEFWRRMHDVGLVSGPEVISCKGNTCGCGCGALLEVEFTLVAGSPYANSLEQTILDVRPSDLGCNNDPDDDDQVVIVDPGDAGCGPDGVEFLPTGDGETCAADGEMVWHPVADGESCGETSESCFTWIPVADHETCPVGDSHCPPPTSCLDDPFCPSPPLPPTPQAPDLADCGCIPLTTTRVCATATPTRVWGSSTLNFDIYAGEKDLRNVAIRMWENPLGKDCCVTGCEGQPDSPTEHWLGCGEFTSPSGAHTPSGPWCDGDAGTSSSLSAGQWAGYILDQLPDVGHVLGAKLVAQLSTTPNQVGDPVTVSAFVGVGPANGTGQPTASMSATLDIPNDGVVREYTVPFALTDADVAVLRAGGGQALARFVIPDNMPDDSSLTLNVHELRIVVNAMPVACVPEFPDCAACATLIVAYVPARGVLRFSGEERTVTVTCGTQTVNALRSISGPGNGPFAWPDIECVPVCVAVDLDCSTVAEDASITVSQVFRDL